MPYEVLPWKEPDAELFVDVRTVTSRPTHSEEINRIHGEGGALNANYRVAEAMMVIANRLGLKGFRYLTDFYFKRLDGHLIVIDCVSPTMRGILQKELASFESVAA